ncbi:MAG: dTMP kinase [Elusimicrobia bacterium RIFOXYB2_FULL_49_7]|nr:MAG: dTMP kinase [Elusimicrobia bacterium RIFOXYB2_FULL_49_7]
MKKQGLFITFEGIDGCGKTTQFNLLADHLKNCKQPCLTTREPGGTPLSETLRSIILNPENRSITDRTELLLYLAARVQHVEEKILPALKQGKMVLCDRFTDATAAYQGGGRKMSPKILAPLLHFASCGLKPDMTFLFDLPVKTAYGRMKKAGKKGDRVEQAGLLFMERVRQAYRKLAKQEPHRVCVISAEKSPEVIHRKVIQYLKERR